MKPEQVIIIGGGPAGIITAIQLQRFGITPVLFEPHRLGGLLWNANLVENYPGFPEGISGLDLVARFERHFKSLGLSPFPEVVTKLDIDEGEFLIHTVQNLYKAAVVVVASGTKPLTFPQEMIPLEAAEKVFYEVAPLLEIQNQEIAIVGAGDAAFDYALNLASRNRVTILNRGVALKALPLLVSRVRQNENILHHQNIAVRSITRHGKKLLLQTSQGKEFVVDYLIGAIGRTENCPEFGDRLKAEESHLVETGRLYYIGDVKNGIFRQTAIAVGDGLRAAMQIHQVLSEESSNANSSQSRHR